MYEVCHSCGKFAKKKRWKRESTFAVAAKRGPRGAPITPEIEARLEEVFRSTPKPNYSTLKILKSEWNVPCVRLKVSSVSLTSC